MDSDTFVAASRAEAADRNPVNYEGLIQNDRIHGRLYVDKGIYEDELRKIFYGGWVFVGHDSEVPKAGDFVCRSIGREPVIMLRGNDGQIRIHSNRCTHRGNTICSIEKGSAKVLACDYHGWTFSLSGELLVVPHMGGFCRNKADLALRGPALVESYRGFVFASFNPNIIPLKEHLGRAAGMIDRAADMSPVGRLRLNAGWMKQSLVANWKMLPENSTDGYHTPFLHASFFQVFRSQYDATTAPEGKRVAEIRDLGGGHAEVNFVPRYKRILEWLGSSEDKMPEYVGQMLEAYGEQRGRKLMFEGPPHATVFPNLFLAEGNIVIFQPVSADSCVQWHTPMLLEGADDKINTRLLRQSEAALGPSSFLLADDAAVFERQQLALRGLPDWMDISRGLNREECVDGVTTSFATDEVSNRGFWQHYLKLMGQA